MENKALDKKYAARRRRVLREIRGAAALFPASPRTPHHLENHRIFRQDTDFFYLTGLEEDQAALLLLGGTDGPRSVLYVTERTPQEERWSGSRLGTRRAKRRFDVDEVRAFEELPQTLESYLKKVSVLHFVPGVQPLIDDTVWRRFAAGSASGRPFPLTISDARRITSPLRFVKDREEIRALKHATEITCRAYAAFARAIRSFSSEIHAARFFDSECTRHGSPAQGFATIVAAGRNATCLHHKPTHQPLWRNDLVLLDGGASFQGYSSDLSRTFPVSGKFTSAQAAVYDIVENALHAALELSFPGKTLAGIHHEAVKVITRGLLDLKLLKGSVDETIEKGLYRKFYMHRTSHWLGLDVHDVAPLDVGTTASYELPLVPGNVFTVEPGLYIDAKDSSVPKHFRGIGIRLEDDVLIQDSGGVLLSRKLPTSRADIEAMMES